MRKGLRKKAGSIGVILLAAVLLLLYPQVAFAEEGEKQVYDGGQLSNDYYIKHLTVTIDVREDNSFFIQEDYVYDFVKSHHGMTRDFALDHYRYYPDGTKEFVQARVDHFKAEGAQNSLSFHSDGDLTYLERKIGDEDKLVSGIQNYHMSYYYVMNTEKPELYFNIVGGNWQCPIGSVDFTVNMPKDFDASTIGFSTGKPGSMGYDEDLLVWRVEGNTISGQMLGVTNKGEAITIRAELPDGYFVRTDYSKLKNVTYIAFVLLMLPSVYMLARKKKSKRFEDVYYPPKDLNPLDVERIYHGKVEHVIALIPYFCGKGYIKVEEVNYNGNKNRRLKAKGMQHKYTKLISNINSLKDDEQKFIRGLFGNKTSSTDSDIEDKIYNVVYEIKEYHKQERINEYEQGSDKLKKFVFLCAVSGVFILSLTAYLYMFQKTDIYSMVMLDVFAVVGVLCVYFGIKNREIFLVIFGILFGAAGIFASLFENPIISTLGIVQLVSGLICCNLCRRTDEGQELYDEVKAYRRFLKSAKPDKLEELMEMNSGYFYNTISYAYALGLSKKWMRKFDRLQFNSDNVPTWWPDNDLRDWSSLKDGFNSLMSDTSSAMSSSYSGSGDSGGSSSDGGSGGGGGGAW